MKIELNKKTNCINGIIFDLDGVLIDSLDIHDRALHEAFSAITKINLHKEELFKYRNYPTSYKLKKMQESFNMSDKDIELIKSLKQKYTLEAFRNEIKPVNEINEIMDWLKSLSDDYLFAPLVFISSNAKFETINLSLEKILSEQNFKYFTFDDENEADYHISSNEMCLPKPSPEGWINLITKYSLEPKEILIIEDSEINFESAINMGANALLLDNPKDLTLDLIKKFVDATHENYVFKGVR